jgi:release factor glutamine methyltransferase
MAEPPPPAAFPSLSDALAWAADRLRAAGIDSPRLEARLLAAHAAGLSSTDLIANRPQPFPAQPLAGLVARRASHVPLAYLTGVREFWSLPFHVSDATLIPRPESESVVAAALRCFPDAPGRVLDLGTGTGCLLLSVLSERPQADGIGADRIPAAAALAASNAVDLGLADRAAFLCGNWADAVAGRFALILSNPPYIPTADLSGLMPEVACHEPRSALDGGPVGLDAYARIIADLPRLLAPGGAAVLELGPAQAVAALARAAGLAVVIEPDLAGIPRVAICSLPDRAP